MMRKKSGHDKVFKKRIASPMMAVLWGYGLPAPVAAFAAPQGGVPTSGSAAIPQSGNVTAINRATRKAAISRRSSSTKPQETVDFRRSRINSRVRLKGSEPSPFGSFPA
ncbi:MAG: hypothetical protein GXY80_09065 [Syntrophorhabdus aromaticivorans]|uniref:Uncharacterized protein n=2 Tax=Syntrophorhabdus aromaticivorans TaxID=328301 RepID=A0A971S104_9BACT|nr:hypothetical protein [Syntrophorhabdus aromaticivorans]